MKKTNKGFSMVELIIVIAIMAILAGALAPALIKYINKSRVSADISTGNTIASGIQTALTDEDAFEDASDQTDVTDYPTFYENQGTNMQTSLDSILGTDLNSNTAPAKSKKDATGTNTNLDKKFYVKMDTTTNEVEVYCGATDAGHMVYPAVGTDFQY